VGPLPPLSRPKSCGCPPSSRLSRPSLRTLLNSLSATLLSHQRLMPARIASRPFAQWLGLSRCSSQHVSFSRCTIHLLLHAFPVLTLTQLQ
jgi:hypothetical protein